MNLQPLNTWLNEHIAVIGGALLAGVGTVSAVGLVAVFNLVTVVSALGNQVENNTGDIGQNAQQISRNAQTVAQGDVGMNEHLVDHAQAAQALAVELATFRNEFLNMVTETSTDVLTVVQLQGLEARLVEVETSLDRELRITSGAAAAPPTEDNWRALERLQRQKRQICGDIRVLVPTRVCE